MTPLDVYNILLDVRIQGARNTWLAFIGLKMSPLKKNTNNKIISAKIIGAQINLNDVPDDTNSHFYVPKKYPKTPLGF